MADKTAPVIGADPPKPLGPTNPLPHDEGAYWFDAAQGDPSEFGAAAAYRYTMPLGQMPAGTRMDSAYSWVPAGGGQQIYTQGDEWLPGSWGPPAIASIQEAMDAAGFLNGNWVSGAWDASSANAFESLLSAANAMGSSWQEVLNRAVADPRNAANARGAARAPLQIKLTSAEDLRALVQAGAQQVYGKYVNEQDLAKFTEAYNAQEAAYQTAAYNQQVTGGTLTAPPQSSAGINRQFEEQFNADHPVEARSSTFMSKLGEIIDALHGPNIRIQP